ncbi:3D domain-containing protein [Clostridium sardiniense]|uniref:3D domain-containing protein n=1 Tax=Clostridium sardiniense TaxID=29369 RepID=UPI003D34266B
MRKILICFFTVLALTSSMVLPAFADNLDESKVKYNQISGEIKDLDNKIADLDSQVNALNAKIQNNKDKITSVEKEIDTTKLKIVSTEKQIEEGQAVLSDRLRAVYKSGSYSISSYIAFIFESNGLGDLLERLNAINKIVTADNDMITGLKSNASALQNDMKSLTSKKEEIVKLNDENNNNLKTVIAKQDDLKASKAKFDAERSKVESVIIENEEKLIAYPINVIDSSSSSISDLQNAVSTLKELLPQLSTSSVKDKVNSYTSKGNSLIDKKKAEEKANNSSNNNNNSNNTKPNNTAGKKTLTMEATAYAGHNTTAMGIKPVRDPNGISSVAVDPSVIPLGSKVYVDGYGYAIASDTGGAIVGNKIDLFMNSEAECLQFGRRTVTVKIIAYPGEW